MAIFFCSFGNTRSSSLGPALKKKVRKKVRKKEFMKSVLHSYGICLVFKLNNVNLHKNPQNAFEMLVEW